jgi:hypothetical protein
MQELMQFSVSFKKFQNQSILKQIDFHDLDS